MAIKVLAKLHPDFPPVECTLQKAATIDTVLVETSRKVVAFVSAIDLVSYVIFNYDITEGEASLWIESIRATVRPLRLAFLPPTISLQYRQVCHHIPGFLPALTGKTQEISALAQKLIRWPYLCECSDYSVEERTVFRRHNKSLIYVKDTPQDPLLGKGHFKKVYYSKDLFSGQAFAFGKIEKMNQATAKRVQEAYISAYGIEGVIQGAVVFSPSTLTLYVITPYCNLGRLADLVEDAASRVKWRERLFPLMITSVRNLHAKGLVHGDIKPDNFFVSLEDGVIKVALADLDGVQREGTRVKNWVCTYGYCSKERFQEMASAENIHTATYAVDNFALGASLYPLFIGGVFPPWIERSWTVKDMYQAITQASGEHLLEQPAADSLADICYQLTLQDAAVRLTADGALKRFAALKELSWPSTFQRAQVRARTTPIPDVPERPCAPSPSPLVSSTPAAAGGGAAAAAAVTAIEEERPSPAVLIPLPIPMISPEEIAALAGASEDSADEWVVPAGAP